MGTQSPGSILRTKHLLAEALMRLAEKRSFKKISVGDICGEARVSRSAFYSHFSDKYELLTFCLEEKIRLQSAGQQSRTLEEQLGALLESVQENRRMLYNIFMADMSVELMDIFRRILHDAAVERMQAEAKAGNELTGDLNMEVEFLTGGLANVILGWIRENCATPTEEMARRQSSLLAALNAGRAKQTEEEKQCFRERLP